ncbi:MAG: enoyl-CoA hydratase/isomerase family protein [Elusimicrobia bacterium]|nr:enoyl-CoA hydratase/isomerase family protein [Elusimicrobiota bacterium]
MKTIKIKKTGKTAEVWLSRPEVHNAFDAAMISELTEAFLAFSSQPDVRSVIITGEGKSFCAGADLNWLGASRQAPYEKHLEDTLKLSAMFRAVYDLDKPVIAAVNGTALGGGMGFLAVSDVVIAARDAVFGLSEVKIGVVPACISPYLFMRCSNRAKLKEYFMSGERFSARAAIEAGLVDYICERQKALEAALEKARLFERAAPKAQGMCKQLFRDVPLMPLDAAARYTASALAKIRTGEEAHRGIDAFFEKRKIEWE